MELSTFLTAAYGVMGVVAVVGYLPQFLAFKKHPEACRTAPVSTWGLWTGQAVTNLGYAVIVNGDPMMMAINGATVMALGSCMVVLVYGRTRVCVGESIPETLDNVVILRRKAA